jgi:hypothetical protein
MKSFPETKVGKFLSGKGVDIVLDVAKVIGVPGASILDAVKDQVLKSDKLTPEDKETALKFLEEDRKYFEIEMQDRADARNREIEVSKTSKNYVQNTLAFLGVGTFIFIVLFVLIKGLKDVPPEVNLLIGTVIGAAIGTYKDIYGYYFGSSRSSGEKDKTISKLITDSQN